MQTIGSFWWLWLLFFLVSLVVVINDQRRRVKSVMGTFAQGGDPFKAMGAAQQGMASTVTAGIVAWVSGILLVLSTIVNLIAYIKSS